MDRRGASGLVSRLARPLEEEVFAWGGGILPQHAGQSFHRLPFLTLSVLLCLSTHGEAPSRTLSLCNVQGIRPRVLVALFIVSRDLRLRLHFALLLFALFDARLALLRIPFYLIRAGQSAPRRHSLR